MPIKFLLLGGRLGFLGEGRRDFSDKKNEVFRDIEKLGGVSPPKRIFSFVRRRPPRSPKTLKKSK